MGGVQLLEKIVHVGVNVSKHFKIFGRDIIFKLFQPMRSCDQLITVLEHHRQTDRLTTYCGIHTALRRIAW